jgi:hypothetical protein
LGVAELDKVQHMSGVAPEVCPQLGEFRSKLRIELVCDDCCRNDEVTV